MTSTSTGPYLVTRRDDGYGDVIPLLAGQRFTLGRANTNRIVLKDELASRDHAEVYFAEDRWRLRELQIGKTRYIFVNQIEELPQVPIPQLNETMSIKKRLSNSRFLTPNPEEL